MIYDSRCTKCDTLSQYTSTVENRTILPACPVCGGKTVRVIVSAPMGYVKGNFAAFRSPVDGSVISTERELRNHNSRNNVVNIHDGYDEKAVVSGKIQPKVVAPDKKEISADVAEAIHAVNSGYKPIVRSQDE